MLNLMIVVQLPGKKPLAAQINLPECWDEVAPDALPHLASLYLATSADMNKYDKTVRAFMSLTSEHWRVLEKLQPDELHDLLKLVDWVFDKLDLTENKLPVIYLGKKYYYGPGKEMENLRFGEWCIAEPLIIEYAHTGDIKLLHQLAAILYRPAGEGGEFKIGNAIYRGDQREKFNIQLIESRTAVMAKLNKPVLQQIYLYFVSSRQRIISQYENLFPADKSKAGNNDVGDDYGWIGLYDDLRGDPKFGGPEKLEDEPIHSVFLSMERLIIKNKKLKEEYDL